MILSTIDDKILIMMPETAETQSTMFYNSCQLCVVFLTIFFTTILMDDNNMNNKLNKVGLLTFGIEITNNYNRNIK